MVDLGYFDKAYLSKYDLDVKLFDKYNFIVQDIMPIRKAYIIVTDKGNKVLKKSDHTVEEFKFITNGLDYIRRSFSRVMQFENNMYGEICTSWNNENYYVMNLVDGRECEFSNPIELAAAAKGLGELHKASEGFRYKTSRYTCGNLIKSLNRKKEEMLFFKKIALMYENKSEFDNIYLKEAQGYIDKVTRSIQHLDTGIYYKLCSEEDKISLCHHDLAHHNIIIKDKEAYFVDFDFAVIDLKIHDLCNLINKVIKNFSFDMLKARLVIENYCSENSLNKNEITILFSMLTFPEDFYEISKDYYTRRKEWDERSFTARLLKKINLEEDREEFLSRFKAELL